MLHLGSTYLIVNNMEKSINFYEKLLDMKPTKKNFDRWAQFNFEGNCIALFNKAYDTNLINSGNNLSEYYNDAYLKYFKQRKIIYGNNTVLNFWIEDLIKEYKRLELLQIGDMSEIMYLNISSPYHFFTVTDPDGNPIEITGGYNPIV